MNKEERAAPRPAIDVNECIRQLNKLVLAICDKLGIRPPDLFPCVEPKRDS